MSDDNELRVLSNHGYADSDTYGECFCGEVYEDSMDMAAHILEKLQAVRDLAQPVTVPGCPKCWDLAQAVCVCGRDDFAPVQPDQQREAVAEAIWDHGGYRAPHDGSDVSWHAATHGRRGYWSWAVERTYRQTDAALAALAPVRADEVEVAARALWAEDCDEGGGYKGSWEGNAQTYRNLVRSTIAALASARKSAPVRPDDHVDVDIVVNFPHDAPVQPDLLRAGVEALLESTNHVLRADLRALLAETEVPRG